MTIKKVLFIFGCILSFLLQGACSKKESYSIKISDSLIVGNEWVEITPPTPLKPDKDWQFIIIELDEKTDESTFEVELVDLENNLFTLRYGGGSMSSSIKYTLNNNSFPQDRLYKTVKIKAKREIKIAEVYWKCEALNDRL